jgi:phosphoheptose isomerase
MALGNERGAKTIGIAGFDGGEICRQATVPIIIPVDSEPWGTPLVESFHVVVHHLICLALKQRIAEA